MSPEERQLLAGLFERLKGAASAPRDQEAEAFINNEIKTQPAAPYLLAQTVIVQEHALQAAGQRLQELEGRVRELQAQAQEKPAAGGFLGGLFGGGAAAPQRPAPQLNVASPGGPWGAQPQPNAYAPQPGYAPQQGGFAPQAQQQGGSNSFLKGALGAAAGVAGGMLLADSIRGLFHGGGAGGLGGLGMASGLGGSGFEHASETTVINNYYGDGANGGGQEAGYDPSYDAAQPMDAGYDQADYDSGYDSGGDGGFDV
jgi:uncharacterized protein